MPTSRRRRYVELLAKIPVIALVYLFFFAISWRPIYAAQGTISFFVIFTGISRAKFIFIREPLVFSDIALVADLFKYKAIFYATSLNVVFWLFALLYVFGASAVYMVVEPHILPDDNRLLAIIAGLLLAFGPWLALFSKSVNKPVAHWSQKLMRTVNVKRNTVSYGTFCQVVLHFVIWMGAKREEIIATISQRLFSVVHQLLGDGETDETPLIIVWQSESFVDMRNLGVVDLTLPTLDRLRETASQWGRLTSVFEGGYTLRTEFAVLSGLQPDDVHADASYPYLRAGHYSKVVWPTKLRNAGWSTHFIHPYERKFFMRHRAMPKLGFDEMTMLDSFDWKYESDGPYVSDTKLTEKVIDIIDKTAEKPSLLFVASMANHGPWEAGRSGSLTGSVEIYLELLKKADEALGQLVDHLNTLTRPTWLVFYGDHAPLLKAFADPFPDPRTDYLIVGLGTAAKSVKARQSEIAPWNLFGAVLQHAGLRKEELK